MINLLTLPAFRDDGTLVQLTDLLALVPEDNKWVWSVLYFYGIGRAPSNLYNLSMSEFKDLVWSRDKGFMMSWVELKEFATLLDQTIDCVIVGANSIQDISRSKQPEKDFSSKDFNSYEIVIEAFDSTEWLVWVRDPKIWANFTITE